LLGEWAILHEKSLFAKWKLRQTRVNGDGKDSAAPEHQAAALAIDVVDAGARSLFPLFCKENNLGLH
jgi:hypothetical protein